MVSTLNSIESDNSDGINLLVNEVITLVVLTADHGIEHGAYTSEMWDFPPLPLLEGEKVIELDPDADYLTKRITDKALDFIKKNRRCTQSYAPGPKTRTSPMEQASEQRAGGAP